MVVYANDLVLIHSPTEGLEEFQRSGLRNRARQGALESFMLF